VAIVIVDENERRAHEKHKDKTYARDVELFEALSLARNYDWIISTLTILPTQTDKMLSSLQISSLEFTSTGSVF
jgi:hypothetical protein